MSKSILRSSNAFVFYKIDLKWPESKSADRPASAITLSQKSETIVRLTKTSSASETTLRNAAMKGNYSSHSQRHLEIFFRTR